MPRFVTVTLLGACVLIAAAFGPCVTPPALPADCPTWLAEADAQEAYWHAVPDESQTARDELAHVAAIRAACQPAPTSTTGQDTTTSSSASSTTTTSTSTTTSVPAPPPSEFPTEANTGVSAGWTPAQTIVDQDVLVVDPGTVIEDVRMVRGNIWVRANDVTIRRVEMQGGRINNSCCIDQPYDGAFADRIPGPGLLVEDVTFTNPPGVAHTDDVYYRLGDSNYTARRVKIVDQLEGFRTGGRGQAGAGEVTIEDSFVRLDTTTTVNVGCGGHPDGIQGYVGEHATITHNTIDLATSPGDCMNGAVFIADNSAGADVTGNLLMGGAFTLRANDGPFRLVDNLIGDRMWQYGPITCGGPGSVGFQMLEMHGNRLATVDSDYTITATGAEVRC